MKLRQDYIVFISKRLVDRLVQGEYIQLVDDAQAVQTRISSTIVKDLKVEDDLDKEVREILEGYTQYMRQQNIEYHEMFQIVKRKLMKERNLVL